MGNDLAGRHRFDTFFLSLVVLVGILCVSHFQVTRMVMGRVGSGGREERTWGGLGGGRRVEDAGRHAFFLLFRSLTGGVKPRPYRHSQALAGTCGHSQARSEASDCLFLGADGASWADFQARATTDSGFGSGQAVGCSGLGGCTTGVSEALAQAQHNKRFSSGTGPGTGTGTRQNEDDDGAYRYFEAHSDSDGTEYRLAFKSGNRNCGNAEMQKSNALYQKCNIFWVLQFLLILSCRLMQGRMLVLLYYCAGDRYKIQHAQ